MRFIGIVVLVIVAHMMGAISHESDIVRACNKYGESRSTGWLYKLKCREIPK